MGSLTESFYDAMAQFVDAVPAGTTVIKATIIERTDEAKNEYTVKYLTNKLTAYANSETIYQTDDEVYILVPDNNLKETLIILAGVDQTATSTTSAVTQNKYENISGNLITDENLLNIIKISSYAETTLLEHPLFSTNSDINSLFKTYFNDYHIIKLSCYIKTALEAAQQSQGNYGLKISIPVINTKIEKENEYGANKDATENLEYTLDVNNILGNPYSLLTDTKQELIIEIPDYYRYETISVPKISIFCNNFPLKTKTSKIIIDSDTTGAFWEGENNDLDGDGTDTINFTNIIQLGNNNIKEVSAYYFSSNGIAYPMSQLTSSSEESDEDYDIFIRDIQVSFLNKLKEIELTGYKLKLEATQGIYFLNESFDEVKTITPTLLIDGKETSIPKSYSIYWLQEDPLINTESEYYLGYAGPGWKCLNDIQLNGHYGFDTSLRTLKVKEEDVLSSCNYRCILLYHDEVVTNDITIINYSNEYGFKIKLKSNRDVYSEGVGKVELTGTLDWTTDDIKETESLSGYWIRWDENNNYIETIETENYISDIANKTVIWTTSYNVDNIVNSNYITFAVYKKTDTENEKLIGSQKIKVSTSTELTHSLSILNDNIIYKYDSDGDSPCIDAYDGPISSKVTAIAPLDFNFFFEDGTQLSESEYATCKVTWRVPIQSMFDINDNDNNLTKTFDNTYYYYKGSGRTNSKLTYNIINKFDKSKASNSDILLTVIFNETTVEKYINIQFLKDGDSGTNGTKYSAILGWTSECIAYNKYDNTYKQYQKLKLCYNNNEWKYYTRDGKLNNISGAKIPFYVKVYKDGEEIIYDSKKPQYTVSYKFFDNKNNRQNIQGYLKIDTIGVEGRLTLSTATEVEKPSLIYNNIIQATIEISTTEDAASATYGTNITLYCYYPLDLIINSQKDDKIPNMIHGFDSVLYASDGTNPQYDTTYPFEMENISDGKWKYFGNLTYDEDKELYTPYYKYDNGNADNRIIYKKDNFEYHKPIIYTYNCYEQSNLNGWDGNKLTTTDGYLIAPQVGAGTKDADNKFTGIVMGIESTNANNITTSNRKVGLFGFHCGERSIFLNADDGSATFGCASSGGQIIIQPGQNSAVIKSNNYSTTNKTGMMIDFSNSTIQYGSNNFSVNDQGWIHSAGGGDIAGWNISNTTLSGGQLTLNSNGSIYSDNHTALDNNGTGFFINKNGLSIGSKFRVNNDGTVYIGNGAYNNSSNHWTINGNSSRSYISFGGDVMYSSAKTDDNEQDVAKVYLGTDGISIGKRFSVDSQGYLQAYRGKIGGWTINTSTLVGGNITLNSTGSIEGGNTYKWSISSNGAANFNYITANKGGQIGGWVISGGSSGLSKEKVGAGTSGHDVLYSKNASLILDGTSGTIYGYQNGSSVFSISAGGITCTSPSYLNCSGGSSSSTYHFPYLSSKYLRTSNNVYFEDSTVYLPATRQKIKLGTGNVYGKSGYLEFSNGVKMWFLNGILDSVSGGDGTMKYSFD